MGRRVLLILLLFCASANAQERKWWVSPGGISAHVERGFNGLNPGAILECEENSTHAFSGGSYLNSLSRTSLFVSHRYTPLELGPARLGIMYGLVSGYEANNGRAIPVVLPAAVIDWARFGLAVSAWPSIHGLGPAGVAIQFRFLVSD